MRVVRSVYETQDEILDAIEQLYIGDKGFQCDLTFGNGQFWKNRQLPPFRFDLDDSLANVTVASSDALPLHSAFLDNLVFDPPFLTYVRAGREGNGSMVMARRFTGYWKYSELQDHYVATLREASRVLKRGGVMVFKCQDIIHNHSMHCTHLNVVNWAQEFGVKRADLFVLVAKHRMPSPNRAGTQKHARIFHSYFLVLRKC